MHWYDALLPGVGNNDLLPGYDYLKQEIGGGSGGSAQDVVNALNGLQQQSITNGQQIKNFLLGREANAEQYLQPMRQMFSNMYGSGGMMPLKAPGTPTSGAPGGGP